MNNEELAYGLRSIAAPVRSHDGAAARARSTSPCTRSMVAGETLGESLGPILMRSAADISARLGFRPL